MTIQSSRGRFDCRLRASSSAVVGGGCETNAGVLEGPEAVDDVVDGCTERDMRCGGIAPGGPLGWDQPLAAT